MRNEKEENQVRTEVNARHKQQTVHLCSKSGGVLPMRVKPEDLKMFH